MASVNTRLSYRRLAATLLTMGGAALACAVACQVMPKQGEDATRATVANVEPPAMAAQELGEGFNHSMKPFLQTYCTECHAGPDAAAGLDLEVQDTSALEAQSERLVKITAKLSRGLMPPVKAEKQPTDEERAAAVAWLKGFAAELVRKHTGDPGVVLAHHLSNAEYNYTIKALTGVDIQPASEFPVDPANQAGFDNSGESLVMDPELLKKYLEAAREVSKYLVFQSDGLAFAPHPVVADTDRDRYAVNRIIDFYQRRPVDLSAYFLAAWHFEQGKASGATIDAVAAQESISPKYLKMVYGLLTDQKEKPGPVSALAAWWRTMKDAAGPAQQKTLAETMAQWVHALRAATRPVFPNLTIPGMDIGSQPFPIWKVRQIEATRFAYQAGSSLKLARPLYVENTPAGPAMRVPAEQAAVTEYEKEFENFALVFPDDFVVTERSPVYLNPNSAEGRLKGHLLNAGLHSQTGYFRDDRPLYELILSDQDRIELDRLWSDLNLITNAPLRQFQSMIWFERTDSRYMVNSDFGFVRAEDMDLGEEPKFSRLRDVFLKDLNPRAAPGAKQAVADYFDYMQNQFKTTAADRTKAEVKQLDSLLELAAKAYRRPVSAAEQEDLLAFYRAQRKENALDHEEAVRDTFVSMLMSPYFCYRFVSPPTGEGPEPLTDYELASRLSYFLWCTMPDETLMAHAAKGDLHQPEILLGQARRMLKDDRVVDLATEFGGNWLDFRQFETHNGVDRERFPTFDNDLREAMYQEPVRFLTNIMRNDAPVLDVLYGDYTFVNAALAKHYGMKVDVTASEWVRVDGARTYQRGGILPMAVFLTKNSPGLRTSPVKRGYWVVKRVLGEEIPAPPPNVPALPPDESKLELPLPETLARHRADASCASCHVRFDSMGLVFEGYGPIGELRTADMAGKPVENSAQFPGSGIEKGLDGLRKYVKEQRQADFVDNLCRKLLADALGRTLILSDEPLVANMQQNLIRNDYKFSALVDTVVTSPQFLTKKKGRTSSKG